MAVDAEALWTATARSRERSCTPGWSPGHDRRSDDGLQQLGPKSAARRRRGHQRPQQLARSGEGLRREVVGERRLIGPLVDDRDVGVGLGGGEHSEPHATRHRSHDRLLACELRKSRRPIGGGSGEIKDGDERGSCHLPTMRRSATSRPPAIGRRPARNGQPRRRQAFNSSGFAMRPWLRGSRASDVGTLPTWQSTRCPPGGCSDWRTSSTTTASGFPPILISAGSSSRSSTTVGVSRCSKGDGRRTVRSSFRMVGPSRAPRRGRRGRLRLRPARRRPRRWSRLRRRAGVISRAVGRWWHCPRMLRRFDADGGRPRAAPAQDRRSHHPADPHPRRRARRRRRDHDHVGRSSLALSTDGDGVDRHAPRPCPGTRQDVRQPRPGARRPLARPIADRRDDRGSRRRRHRLVLTRHLHLGTHAPAVGVRSSPLLGAHDRPAPARPRRDRRP